MGEEPCRNRGDQASLIAKLLGQNSRYSMCKSRFKFGTMQQPSSIYTSQQRRDMVQQHYHSCAQQNSGRRASAALTLQMQYECERQPNARRPHRPCTAVQGLALQPPTPSTGDQPCCRCAAGMARLPVQAAPPSSVCLPAAGRRGPMALAAPAQIAAPRGVTALQTPAANLFLSGLRRWRPLAQRTTPVAPAAPAAGCHPWL